MKEYHLNKEPIKRLLKNNLVLLALIIIFTVFLVLQNEHILNIGLTILLFILGWLFLHNIPAIILLIQYYHENKKTSVIIESDRIAITDNGKTRKIQFHQIESSIYNVGVYYKNILDDRKRWQVLHSDFGYWEIKLSSGERYYLSSLIVDFLHETPLVNNTKYRFRFLPFMNKKSTAVGIDLVKKIPKTKTENFVDLYQSKSEDQLKEIINDSKGYQKEAREAAEIVLNNKTLGNSD